MTPIKFAGATHNHGAPKGWDEAKMGPCYGLPTTVDEVGNIVSVWELTPRERLQIGRGDNVVLLCCGVQPPVILSVAPLHQEGYCAPPKLYGDSMGNVSASNPTAHDDTIYARRETAVHGLFRHARAGR